RPPGAAEGARLFKQILDYREPEDVVILNNGDTLSGELKGLDERRLALQTSQGPSPIDRSGIRAVILNSSLLQSASLAGEGALVSLVDGSRFRARDLKFGALDRLPMQALAGITLDIPLSAVESLRFLGGCATYLSELAPVDYRFEPFLDLEWPL